MATPGSSLSVLQEVASQSQDQQTPKQGSSSMDVLKEVQADPTLAFKPAPEQSTLQPYDKDKFGKFTTQENYPTWARTQPKVGPDSKPGEYEAWTGAHLSPSESLKAAGEAAAPALAVPLAAEGGSYLLSKAPQAAEAVLKHLEGHAAEYMEKYPNLIKLAGALGIPTSAAGVLLYLHHNSK